MVGMSVARKFGKKGFRVTLVSCNQTKLDGYVGELKALDIEAGAFPADVCNRPQLIEAIDRIKDRYGNDKVESQ